MNKVILERMFMVRSLCQNKIFLKQYDTIFFYQRSRKFEASHIDSMYCENIFVFSYAVILFLIGA